MVCSSVLVKLLCDTTTKPPSERGSIGVGRVLDSLRTKTIEEREVELRSNAVVRER